MSTSKSLAGSRTAADIGVWAESLTGRTKQAARANRRPGYHYLHIAVDKHSRLAYTQILGNKAKETAAVFWQRPNAWFQAKGSRSSGQRKLLPVTGFHSGPALKCSTKARGPNAHKPTA